MLPKYEHQRFKHQSLWESQYRYNVDTYIPEGIEMTLLEKCKKSYDKLYLNTGITCSVVRLCNEHNLELAKELNEKERQPKLFMKRVTTLWNKPVVEESRQGKTFCLLCEVL